MDRFTTGMLIPPPPVVLPPHCCLPFLIRTTCILVADAARKLLKKVVRKDKWSRTKEREERCLSAYAENAS